MNNNPDVIEMVLIQLKAGGYEGLYHDTGECACKVDELAPCGQIESVCIAGYVGPCGPDCGEDHKWHIQASKPQKG